MLSRQATLNQAKVIAQGRISSVPAERKTQRRNRRISMGAEAESASKSLLEIWEKSGTADDGFRPENNQAGFIAPSSNEVINNVLAKAEKQRANDQLRQYSRRGGEYKPTQPVAPRLGPKRLKLRRPSISLQDVEMPVEVSYVSQHDSSYVSQPLRLGNSPEGPRDRSGHVTEVSERPLGFIKPLHATVRQQLSTHVAPATTKHLVLSLAWSVKRRCS